MRRSPLQLLPHPHTATRSEPARITSRRAGVFYLSICAALTFFTAVATYADPLGLAEQHQSRGAWMSNLVWFVGGVAGALTIIGFTRRKPPLEVEFMRREEADKRLQGITEKIDGLRIEMRTDLRIVANDMKEQGRVTEAQLREIFLRLGQIRREGSS